MKSHLQNTLKKLRSSKPANGEIEFRVNSNNIVVMSFAHETNKEWQTNESKIERQYYQFTGKMVNERKAKERIEKRKKKIETTTTCSSPRFDASLAHEKKKTPEIFSHFVI